MAEEWQEAMTVAEIERIIKTTEPREMSSNGDRVWTRRMAEALHATVERTIFNEALRRAADKIDPHPDMRDDELTQWGKDRREAANQIRALIKEPGHE